nr:MAG TPA: hypothetical protein [Caudoviricetes sp.]
MSDEETFLYIPIKIGMYKDVYEIRCLRMPDFIHRHSLNNDV